MLADLPCCEMVGEGRRVSEPYRVGREACGRELSASTDFPPGE
jgi:hypothetical protein